MKTTTKKPSIDDIRRAIWDECGRLAQQAFRLMSEIVTEEVYLIGRKENGVYRELQVSRDCPDGWQYVNPQRISPAMTIQQVGCTIHEWLKREPLWIVADANS